MSKPIVAIVGRPNVGKSTLFNVLAGEMISIVKDTPGVTRDRIYADVSWLDNDFTIIDTGGIEPDSGDVILSQMREQAQIAIDTADVIIFITDVHQGLVDSDAKVADMLRRSGKPVVLAVNKVDSIQKYMMDVYEFYNLGIGEPFAISAANRQGLGDMLDEVVKHFPEDTGEDEDSDIPKIAIVGKPNVGKSSLINKLCNRKSLARVSSTPGKTATINFYAVDDCYFVDLPGYGYAKVSNADRERWDDLINSYFEAQRHHTLLVQLIDCRHAPSADDIQMLQYLHYHNIPFVVALTKADKLKKSQLAQTQEEFEKLCLPYGCQKVVLTSGESGYGIPELQAVLNAAVAAEYEANAEDAE